MSNLNAYEAERNEILMSTNREYSKMLEAEENIYKMLEYAVKLDITNIGKVSDMTKTVVESFHYKIYNNTVFREKDILPEEYADSKQTPVEPDAGKAEQVSNTNKGMKNQYISYAYENGKNKVLYGNSIDEIISKWQKIENSRSEENKLGYCYIKRNDDSSKVSRYEIATGRDVTLIYLKLPPMKKDEFAETVKQLKDDGAKFNKAKKEWYVTKDMDLSKFEKYISSKESVLGKLENNREKISENDKNNPREDITKKHEQQI